MTAAEKHEKGKIGTMATWRNLSTNQIVAGQAVTPIPVLESPGFLTDIRQIINDYAKESERGELLEYCRSRFEENEHWVFFARSYLIHLLMSKPCQGQGHTDNLRLVSLLIQAGYDMNVRDAMGNSPLHQAVKLRDPKGVQFLILSGCDVNLLDSEGKTALIRAVKAKPCLVEIIKSLLTMSKDLDIDFVDTSGWNALCYAAHCDDVDICHLLLSLGANPNFSLSFSLISPLSVAIQYSRNITIVRLLIETETFINRSEGIPSDHLLDIATIGNRLNVIHLLNEAGVWYDKVWFLNVPFLTAVRKDRLSIVKFFIEIGGVQISSVNPDTKLSATIVHEAARFGSLCVLKYLIDTTDLDLDFCKNSNGMTPLMLTVLTRRTRCLKELLSAGANGRIPLKINGETPLHYAVSSGSVAVILLLLENFLYKRSDAKQLLHRKQGYAAVLNCPRVGPRAQILIDWSKAVEVPSLQDQCIVTLRSCLGQRPVKKLQSLNCLPYRLIELVAEIVHIPCFGDDDNTEYTKDFWHVLEHLV